MTRFAVLLLATLSLVPRSLGQTKTCDDYNFYPSFTWSEPSGYTEHKNGSHSLNSMFMEGECEYSSNDQQYCQINAQSFIDGSSVTENGSLTSLIHYHNIVATDQGGSAASTGPQIATAVTGAVAADSCTIGLGCNINITFSASASGVGVSVTFPPTNLSYTYQHPYQTTCGAQLDPQYQAPTCTGNPGFVCSNGDAGGSVSPTCSNGQWTCNGATQCSTPPSQYVCSQGEYGEPSCGPGGWYCYQSDSPIIIDTAGTGFQLTDFQEGVWFDMKGDGHRERVSWTAPGSKNGWLALDRNGDGKIDSGKELFGNYTDQPTSSDPNGFLALAVFDMPENGGNGDGVIDSHDAVWAKLRIWIDENHDGISQPNELHTLPSLGINSLALAYVQSKFADQFGNQFRYKGTVNPDGQPDGDHVDRTMYDVFLGTAHQANNNANTQPSVIDKTISQAEHTLN